MVDLCDTNHGVRNWAEWHRGYEDPSSSLARRLAVVRRHVSDVVSGPRQGQIRVLSLCAGDGRDLLPVLADRRPPMEFAVLVEKYPVLAETARRTATDRQLEGVTVITGDAGDPVLFGTAHPVDLLLLCGIFGNVAEDDIKKTVAATPALLRDYGTVIWTRGSTNPRPATVDSPVVRRGGTAGDRVRERTSRLRSRGRRQTSGRRSESLEAGPAVSLRPLSQPRAGTPSVDGPKALAIASIRTAKAG